jgi:hypothetical protein
MNVYRPPARFHRPAVIALACACALLAGLPGGVAWSQQPSQPVSSTAPAKAGNAVFSAAELDQMLAPIALYPDSLLAQILMAATYPGEVADAAAWSKAHPDAKGDAAVKQVADKDWDPSVQSLVAFPQVLDSLGQDAKWVTRLGDAFLADPKLVMDSVQRLRAQAEKAGNLKSNEYQNVSEQPATGTSGTQTIVIESKDPDVVYVPSYNPSYVYGSYGWGAYPPYYYPPAGYWYPGAALGAGIMFGIGVGIVGGLWGDCDWNNGDININSERYNNFERNVNRESNRGDRQGNREGNRQDRQANRQNGNGKWQHDSAHREGTPYRDQGSRDKFDGPRGADNGLRGDTPGRSQQRDQARNEMGRRGMETPARSNMEAQNRARQTASNSDFNRGQGGFNNQGGGNFQQRGQNNTGSRDAARSNFGSSSQGGARNNAFSGAGSGNSGAASQRGRSSSSMSRSSGSRGASSGRSMSRPSMSRGGGGRRR